FCLIYYSGQNCLPLTESFSALRDNLNKMRLCAIIISMQIKVQNSIIIKFKLYKEKTVFKNYFKRSLTGLSVKAIHHGGLRSETYLTDRQA
ncbi:MAG: hypothetical protein MZV64_06615, partial [Ignavibacteriales bacterium]|nr:hypothetical protein [Ignavibacteriales bacterium]